MALPSDIDNRIQTQLQAGYSPSDIQHTIEQKYGVQNYPVTPKKTGFSGLVQNVLQGTGLPRALQTAEELPHGIATLGAAAINRLVNVGQNKAATAHNIESGFNQEVQNGVNIPLAGQTKPVGPLAVDPNASGIGVNPSVINNINKLNDTVGVGLKAGTTIAGGMMGPVIAPEGLSGAGSALARVGIGAGRSAIQGGLLGLGNSLENSDISRQGFAQNALKNTVTGTAVGGVVGAATQGATEGINAAKNAIGPLGQKIETSIIKPSAQDVKDGYDPATLQKYDLGGTLKQVEEKTQSKLSDLSSQLHEATDNQDAQVNLNDVLQKTKNDLLANKVKMFGTNTKLQVALAEIDAEIQNISPSVDPSTFSASAQKAIENMAPDISGAGGDIGQSAETLPKIGDVSGLSKSATKEVQSYLDAIQKNIEAGGKPPETWGAPVSPTGGTPGQISLGDAQDIKQAVGKLGAWQYGSSDPNANAMEKVANAFYKNLKAEIEKQSPEDVAEINQQISDLIPVQNAIIRRIPVAARSNVLGLGDLLSGVAGAASHPAGAGMFAINQLSKSGRVAGWLMNGAKNASTDAGTVGPALGSIARTGTLSTIAQSTPKRVFPLKSSTNK